MRISTARPIDMASGTFQFGENRPQTPKQFKFSVDIHDSHQASSPFDESLLQEESIFSPQESIGTDITDDYSLDTSQGGNTPPSEEKISFPTPIADAHDSTISSSAALHALTPDTPSRSPLTRKAKSTECLISRLNTSDIQRKDEEIHHVGKRKQESATSPIETTNSEDFSLIDTFIEIRRKNATNGIEHTKRFRDAKNNFWVSENQTLNRDIHIDFMRSPPSLSQRKPRAHSEGTGTRPALIDQHVSITYQRPGYVTSISQDIPTISISAPDVAPETQWPSRPKCEDSSVTNGATATLTISDSKEVQRFQKLLSRIIPLEIRQRLKEDCEHCPAWTTKDKRCQKSRRTNMQDFFLVLEEWKSDTSGEIDNFIQDLIEVVLCPLHQKVAAKKLQEVLLLSGKLSTTRDSKSQRTVQSSCHIALLNWIRTLKGEEDIPIPGVQASIRDKVEITLPVVTMSKIDNIQKFVAYTAKRNDGKSTYQVLEKLITRPLNKSEIQHSGFMYMFWQPGNFGYLKIGRTKDIERRLRQWEKGCQKQIYSYFPTDEQLEDKIGVQHIYRVEALVHAELRDKRQREQSCPGCHRNHIEWFEVFNETAKAIVRKWMNWMRKSPYVKRYTNKGKLEWVLDDDEERIGKLEDLCTPHSDLSAPLTD
jgi:hypothetical protein